MTITQDISGNRYGRLVVIDREGQDKSGNTMWRCVCDCGKTSLTRSFMLKNGRTQSCGCYRIDVISQKEPRITVESKACSSCGVEKNARLFGRKKTSVDGLSSQCNACKNTEYKRRNKDRVNELSRCRKEIMRAAHALNDTQEKVMASVYEHAKRAGECIGSAFHVDHIIPFSSGGKHSLDNVQVVPWIFNLKKGTSTELFAGA